MTQDGPFDGEDTEPGREPVLRVEGNVVRYRGEALDLSGVQFASDEERLRHIAQWLEDVTARRREMLRARTQPGKF